MLDAPLQLLKVSYLILYFQIVYFTYSFSRSNLEHRFPTLLSYGFEAGVVSARNKYIGICIVVGVKMC